ncbi:MAG: nucleotidyl transferase AbiEii/AbiGii toxin family protein [bacterium]|nr:nucleotidyl transferase AbiEii/AbiGii toxin family protein [bacterium]MBU1916505.1 nucleotidyl transferase AbiEii/AbiGii toxin family protein [bacterium]
MNKDLIQQRLDTYKCQTILETEDALREITQEIILAGLSRTNFFKHTAFQGGTCLRIFYGLNRFSEDLDFITKKPWSDFNLMSFLNTVQDELKAFGYNLEIVDRSKTNNAVKKAFLKDDSIGKILNIHHLNTNRFIKKIKIKLEVDTNPPKGSHVENKFNDFPFAYSITLQDLPSLFAGKLHAVLCREYVKGRDWYDLIWYMSRKTLINYDFLTSALIQQGSWKNSKIEINAAWCIKELKNKIKSLDWNAAKNDVKRFLNPNEVASLEIWGKDFFIDRVDNFNNTCLKK